MPRRTAIVSVQQLKDINMIPMIDVMMFLLVVFIITVPLIEQGIPVNLPRGTANDVDAQHTRSITLNLQGQLFLDTAPVSKEALASEMNLMGRADPELTVLVRADEGIQYARVVEVMKILHDANIVRMALVTSPEVKPAK
jgi:biopolymer transport protein TolR